MLREPPCRRLTVEMDPFVAITLGSLVAILAAFLVMGAYAPPRYVSDVLSRRDNERWATQLQVEAQDLPEMLASANSYRRGRGLPEVTIKHFQQKAARQQQVLIRQAELHRAGTVKAAEPGPKST